MVLADLGSKVADALRKMTRATVVDQTVMNEMLAEICKALLQADVNVAQVKALRESIKKNVDVEALASGLNKRKMLEQAVCNELCAMLDPGKEPYVPKKKQPNVIMFVGLQGCGKTTTCTKYAHLYKRKGFKCALVCADTFRAGAFDQLKQNATKAKIPFYGSYTETDPAQIAAEGVAKFKEEGYEVIIVDTSGRHMQEEALFEEMEQVAQLTSPDDIVFASAFKKKVAVGSCIITKLDGHAKGGGALSAVAATGAPITHIGTGEHIEDFEDFEVKSFVSRMLGKGNIKGLMEKMKQADVDLEKQAPEMMKRLQSGQWTLRDMREQFQAVLKMGPLGNIMSQFPGMAGLDFHDSGVRIKKWMTMMDSMTEAELDETKAMAPSRIIRIARGSGHYPHEVAELLEQFKLMQTTMQKTMKKSKKMGKAGGGMDLHNMDASTVAQMMHKMNPQMLQHLGGQQGIEAMMAEMEKEEKKLGKKK
ncbi:signal recognition particle 54 kda protein [Chrysochromulina tobinii]|uniref:signal-recognition-particle GTPase n=1 Tax=Chrysochromulina tobinii TaxID=1460289 RepID=A0A0M0JD84_9EUKA|nr:signal recognition particle 54 kda protein [Chrysochromulina tobinii]|eukprot:KOO24534.1 signal recognition particle 54 kda protein [Chrysochromulina sp. CCMP291]